MFPIGDEEVRGVGPGVMTIALIGLNALIFLFEATLSVPSLESFVTQYGSIRLEILRGQDWCTLLASMFLHGGWFHLIGNMLFLWMFGDNKLALGVPFADGLDVEAGGAHCPSLIPKAGHVRLRSASSGDRRASGLGLIDPPTLRR